MRLLKLYWCMTADHHEDWFVVARSKRGAVRFFEDYEGYEDDAWALEVMALPDALQDDRDAGWPKHEVLLECGARILRADTPRVVELRGVHFAEGMLEHEIRRLNDDLIENRGHGRPNQTTRTRTS